MVLRHPIPLIDQVIQSLRQRTDGSYALMPEAADAAKESLAALLERPELPSIVSELCALAVWLERERGSAEAKEALLDVAATAVATLRERGADRVASVMEAFAGRRAELDRITGAPPQKRAFDESPPPGSASGPLARFDLARALPKKKE